MDSASSKLSREEEARMERALEEGRLLLDDVAPKEPDSVQQPDPAKLEMAQEIVVGKGDVQETAKPEDPEESIKDEAREIGGSLSEEQKHRAEDALKDTNKLTKQKLLFRLFDEMPAQEPPAIQIHDVSTSKAASSGEGNQAVEIADEPGPSSSSSVSDPSGSKKITNRSPAQNTAWNELLSFIAEKEREDPLVNPPRYDPFHQPPRNLE